MSSLIKTEWLKIRKYPAFWWMTGIVILSYPGINLLFYFFYQNQLDDKNLGTILKMLGNPFGFPEVWHTVAYFSSWFISIPAIVVIMFITNEYTYKTQRQNIIDGWSRRQFMTAKLIDVMLISLLITIVYCIVSLVIGFLNTSSFTEIGGNKLKYIPLFFLQTFSQLSIAFLIAFLARKAFIALGIFLFYYIILENVLAALFRHYANDIGRFLPLEISDRIIPVPTFLGKTAGREGGNWYERSLSLVNEHIIYTLLLLILTWVLCFWLKGRRDL